MKKQSDNRRFKFVPDFLIGAAALIFLANPVTGRGLDQVDFGVRASEEAHKLRVNGESEVVRYSDPDIKITEVTASERAENAHVTIDGDPDTMWSGSGEVWLEYRLNQSTSLEHIGIQAREGRNFKFKIQVATDTDDWLEAYEGETGSSGEPITYRFEKVETDRIRISCFGDQRNWNNIRQVRIGNLHWPDAYPAAAPEKALGEPGRRLLPPENGYIDEAEDKVWGGSVFVTMKVDPEEKNYFTARFWGGEAANGRLVLLADGKLLSHTGHGDIEPVGMHSGKGFPGRFYYSTAPLPRALTEGRTNVELEIRHFGRSYRYNPGTLKRPGLYWPIEEPSRVIYNAYTHTDPFFTPPADEPQGEKPPMTARPEELRGTAGEMVEWMEEQLAGQVENAIERMQAGEAFNVGTLLAVYDIEWLPFYRDQRITDNMERIMERLDTLIAEGDFSAVRGNPGGGLAENFLKISDYYEKQGLLDATIEVKGESVSRRKLYADAFVKAQESGLAARRSYTNQMGWSDGGIYPMNRALEILAPDRAMPEKLARRIVLEMIGLEPLSGNWPNRRPRPDALIEAKYKVYTDKGHGRESGYVGGYGEMHGGVASNARHFKHDPEMQEQILAQARHVLEGRTYVRYPHWDSDGFRIMRIQEVIGSRATNYPGRGGAQHGYVNLWDVGRMRGDDLALRFLHRRVVDGRMFKDILGFMNSRAGRRSPGMIINSLQGWRYYQQWLEKHDNDPPEWKLPVEKDGDFVWSDEQNAVVLFKYGDDFAWVNFMFRNPGGVNNLARVHYRTPAIDRLATMRVSSKFDESGEWFVRHALSQWTDTQRPGTPWAIIPGLESYWQGERLPKNAGRPGSLADFYEGRYGNYYIAMNTSDSSAFRLELDDLLDPGEKATNLATGDIWTGGDEHWANPRQTVVLYLGGE